ncbi:MAG TPA: cyclic nucleotide-binding domain-containing protein, partial [Thermoanaerobaculia bacterium]|nr:cyclic nucleotide-binding domain-containing protein [Thermoanaerobaculia bacterium]
TINDQRSTTSETPAPHRASSLGFDQRSTINDQRDARTTRGVPEPGFSINDQRTNDITPPRCGPSRPLVSKKPNLRGEAPMPEETFLLPSLSADSRRELLYDAERRTLSSGEILFEAGDQATNLYILEHGEIALEVAIPGPEKRELMRLAPGQVFGWSAILGRHLETATARAVAPSEVIVIEARSLLASIESNNRLGVDLYRTLAGVIASRLFATRVQMLELLTPVA